MTSTPAEGGTLMIEQEKFAAAIRQAARAVCDPRIERGETETKIPGVADYVASRMIRASLLNYAREVEQGRVQITEEVAHPSR